MRDEEPHHVTSIRPSGTRAHFFGWGVGHAGGVSVGIENDTAVTSNRLEYLTIAQFKRATKTAKGGQQIFGLLGEDRPWERCMN
jgi:hypothetical protein